MAKILVLYYSSYGHVAALARAMAQGCSEAGVTADIRRVAETAPANASAKFVVDESHPEATVDSLPDYDGIIIGSPTRYGRLSSQMAAFLDGTGKLWQQGALNGKVGGAFTSTGTQHGGQETTLFSLITNLLHFGMVIVGLPYSFSGQSRIDEVTGGAPYGATTLAGSDGRRPVSENELAGARYHGQQVARLVLKLFG